MSLYHIIFEGDEFFVEARSFGEAVELWSKVVTPDDEPESVTLLTERSVIRSGYYA